MNPNRLVAMDAADIELRARWLAPMTIMAGSLVTIIPVVASIPLLPPFGLMMLLAWRVRRPDVFRSWAPVPLGLFDDLLSGQPLGSAMLLWTLAFLVLDALDARMFWRDFWQDWVVASGVLAACLIAGRLIATPLVAHVQTALLIQIVVTIALYPVMARITAWLDPRPQPA